MYSGVPTSEPSSRLHRFRRQPRPQRFRHAEVDHLDDWLAVTIADEDVGGLQVPVQHALLMGVLDGLADLQEQLEPGHDRQRALDRRHVVIGSPGTYSIAKYGRPSPVRPPSKTVAMLGWLRIASA